MSASIWSPLINSAGELAFSATEAYPLSSVGKAIQQRIISAGDYPFLAPSDGVTNASPALQAFFDYCTQNKCKGIIPAGLYALFTKLTITIGSGGWSIVGVSSSATQLRPNSTFSGNTVAVQLIGAATPVSWELAGFSVLPLTTSGAVTTGFKVGNDLSLSIGILGYAFSQIRDVVVNSFPTCWDFVHCRMIKVDSCAGWNLAATQNTILSIRQNGAFTGDLVFEKFQSVTTRANANTCLTINSAVGPFNVSTGFCSVAGIKFKSCDFYAGDRAIKMFASSVGAILDIWFSDGCQVDQETNSSVYIEAQNASTLIENIHLEGLSCAKSNSGTVVATSTGTFGVIKSLFVQNCILLAAQAQAIILSGTGVISPIITSNSIVDCNYVGAAIDCGNSSNPTVTGNKARTGLLNQKPSYLVGFNAGATNIICANNDGIGAVNTSTVLDSSGAVVKSIIGNLGYNPLPSTAITVTGSPFSYTNNTGSALYITITGGVISSVTVAGRQVATATNVGCILAPGAVMITTYTVLPTITYMGL